MTHTYYDRDGAVITEEAWKPLWNDDDYRIVRLTDIGPWSIIAWWTGVDEKGGAKPRIFRSGLLSRPKDGVPIKETYRYVLQESHHATLSEALAKHDLLVTMMDGDDIEAYEPLSSTGGSSCHMSGAAAASHGEPASAAAPAAESDNGGCCGGS